MPKRSSQAARSVLYDAEHGATLPMVVNGVLSTSIRCMMTASLRASATLAFFIPLRLAIFIAQLFNTVQP